MSFGRAGKAPANERKYPFIVEVPVAANGLDVELNGQIVGFHKSRGIPPRFGRTAFREGRSYYRWCFSELEVARAFAGQFDGAFYTQLGFKRPPLSAALVSGSVRSMASGAKSATSPVIPLTACPR
jgi:hypothetical protein